MGRNELHPTQAENMRCRQKMGVGKRAMAIDWFEPKD